MSQDTSCESNASPCNTKERGAQVSFPPPLVFLAGIVSGVLLRYLIVPFQVPLTPALRVPAGLLVLFSGVGLILISRVLFLRTGQSPIPWKPTPELIFRGPFRFTRNPMYLGQFLIHLGFGLALNNLWISCFAVPALLVVHLIAVVPEERYLSEKFGEPYRSYLGRVRRYL